MRACRWARSRSPPACGAGRSRSRPATSLPLEPAYEALLNFIRERHSETLFSEDGSTVDEQIAGLLTGRTIAVAESCTGGMLSARLTDRPGSSAYFAGGVVAYSNEAKSSLVGVDPELIASLRRRLDRGGGGARRRRRSSASARTWAWA